MTVAVISDRRFKTIADLIRDLGVSPSRIRSSPPPGRATLDDLIRINERKQGIYELVDGTLVEKVMGATESLVAVKIAILLGYLVQPRQLGFILGPDGVLRLMPKLARAPDVSFIRREKCKGGKFPRAPVPELVPDLAIEVLSKSNRRGEMKRKLEEYFAAGISLVWFIDPVAETAEVFTAANRSTRLTKNQVLDGGEVLPGFKLPLADLFADLEELPETKTGNGRRKR